MSYVNEALLSLKKLVRELEKNNNLVTAFTAVGGKTYIVRRAKLTRLLVELNLASNEDHARSMSDRRMITINNVPCFGYYRWVTVRSGDVIKIRDGGEVVIPA